MEWQQHVIRHCEEVVILQDHGFATDQVQGFHLRQVHFLPEICAGFQPHPLVAQDFFCQKIKPQLMKNFIQIYRVFSLNSRCIGRMKCRRFSTQPGGEAIGNVVVK